MDKLPTELAKRVMEERAAGRTWMEIEDLSPTFEEWGKVEQSNKDAYLAAFRLFPNGRIPHSTLSRWYDLRVDQVKKEVMTDQVRAREIAALFAGKELKDLPETVRTAISDQLFGMMQNGDEKSRHKAVAGLLALGVLLNEQRKVQLKERQIQTGERALQLKIDLIREKVEKLKKGVEGSGKKQLSPEQLKQRVDEIYGLSAA